MFRKLSGVNKSHKSSVDVVVDSFLSEIRKRVLAGEFRDGYRAAMELACDISILCSLFDGVPMDGLIREYFDILSERVELVNVGLHNKEGGGVCKGEVDIVVDKCMVH